MPLRLDYCQYSRDARAVLLWERPRKPPPPRTASWRNLWGLTEKTPTFASRFQETIPTRFLFSRPPALPKLAVDLNPVLVVGARPPASATLPAHSTASKIAFVKKRPEAKALARLARPATRPAWRSKVSPSNRPPDAMANQLLSGQAVTLRALYFEQGQVLLLPAVLASLDTLAQVLRRYPALRLEVQGHTDNQGDPTLNQVLSLRRAEAVCQYLGTRALPPFV